MLRITNALSSKAATRYYNTSLAQADYYAEEPGFWGGKGAQRLGLVGQVTREQFGAIAENRDPRNRERLTVRTKDDRRAGYDFTFSVPKSVSLYVAMSGDRRVERMIMESFRETMTLIENAIQTRVRGKGWDGVERDCDRLLRAGGGLVTTLEVLAEESAMLERVQAGRGRYEEIRRSGDWTFLSPLLGGRTEESSAQGAALQGYGYLCPGSGR
jgi:TrwC relaxase